MKTKYSLITYFTIAFFSSSIFAAGDSTGVVSQPLIGDTGVLMFLAGTHNNKPACSTQGDAWAFDVKTSAGKSMQAFLMLAYAQGKTIHVVGSGDCKDWGDRERPTHFFFDQ